MITGIEKLWLIMSIFCMFGFWKGHSVTSLNIVYFFLLLVTACFFIST